MTHTEILEKTGIDEVCNLLLDGLSLTKIAKKLEVRLATFLGWIASDPERSARVSATRQLCADTYADQAGEAVEYEPGMGKVKASMQKEKAHHLRWLAAMSDPGRFGTKVELSGKLGIHKLTEDELDAQAAALTEQLEAAEAARLKTGNLPPA